VGTTYNADDSFVIFSSMAAKTNDTTTARGREAEDRAARYLESCGQRVVERNFRVRGGEIDLIVRDGRTLVFVEVRQRGSSDFGGAAASITAGKQRRIILAARHYLLGKRECDCRFDCVLIDGEQLQWIRNAFSADD
jgi:putative endonuclease